MKGLCSTSHRLKWGPFPPNEVGRIAQHVRKGEGKKEGKDGVGHRNHSFGNRSSGFLGTRIPLFMGLKEFCCVPQLIYITVHFLPS